MKFFCKTNLIVFVFLAGMLAMATTSQANLVNNGDFAGNVDGWNFDVTQNWAGYYNADHDVAVFGWTDGSSIFQNTGAAYQANTVYEMTVIISSPTVENPNQYEGAELALISIDDGVWTDVITLDYWFPEEDQLTDYPDPGTFREVTMTFDTADPSIVGTNIGVGIRAIDTGDWGPFGWMYVQSVTLVTDPAPVSITEQPQSQRVLVGENADFAVETDAGTEFTVSYQWYYSETANVTPEDDIELTDETLSSISLTGVDDDDAGYYYCVVSFDSTETEDSFEETSDMGKLVVGSKVAYWTLDLADFVEGQYLDSVGARHAVPEVVPSENVFVDGMVGEGLDLASDLNAAARAGTDSPAELNDELTIALWVKWDGPDDPDPDEADWQGIVSKRGYVEDPEDPEELTQAVEWMFSINPEGTQVIASTWLGGWVSGPGPAEGEWVHLALTVDSNTGAALYQNGSLAGQQASGFNLGNPAAELLLGAARVDEEDDIVGHFNGVIDDVKIYNYALTNMEVAELVFDDSGIRGCVEDYRPELDWTGDCIVGFGEFSALAQYWLHDGLTSTE